jgi:hypothetical protein
MEKQCNAISRSCYFYIRNIGYLRPFISEDAYWHPNWITAIPCYMALPNIWQINSKEWTTQIPDSKQGQSRRIISHPYWSAYTASSRISNRVSSMCSSWIGSSLFETVCSITFSRYLPPEQSAMVTTVLTRLHQLCVTTYHSTSKL